ncbi:MULTISPECIES: transporter substrate-binding domain-containing protein [Legionella]|uniref:transporter substrate-binding domain-containing protein n=1 Tax=Legionella TaxID=445 RepID=UPI001056A68E|nr:MULTISPECIES: transporter substrate-binding domain-containing protein [Legionella]MCE3046007.1 transporter substrate-binding domain-containing protein [Legionella sp. 16cNR16C]
MKIKGFCFLFWLGFMMNVIAATPVKIGTPFFDPPFATNDGHYLLNGFDIDLMKKICEKLHWECQFVSLEGPQLYTALSERKIDYAIGDIAITPSRQLNYLFSIPYMITEGAFVTLTDSPLTTLKSLSGKRVGVMSWRVYNEYLQQHNDLNITVVPFDDFNNLAIALARQDIDAVFMNKYSALYLVRQHPDKIKLMNIDLKINEGIGIASYYGNEKNMDLINHLILQFQADGTFVNLYNYNFGFFIRR